MVWSTASFFSFFIRRRRKTFVLLGREKCFFSYSKLSTRCRQKKKTKVHRAVCKKEAKSVKWFMYRSCYHMGTGEFLRHTSTQCWWWSDMKREKLNSSFRQHVNAIGRWCSGNSPFFNVIIRRTKTDGFHVSSNPQWWCNFAPFAFLSSTHTIRHRRLSISDSFILKRSSERKKFFIEFPFARNEKFLIVIAWFFYSSLGSWARSRFNGWIMIYRFLLYSPWDLLRLRHASISQFPELIRRIAAQIKNHHAGNGFFFSINLFLTLESH